jgi:hypothetical protein
MGMIAEVEQVYMEVLQTIEMAILDVWHDNPGLLDFDVEDAVGALISRYNARRQGRPPREPAVHGLGQNVYTAMEPICAWWLDEGTIEPALTLGLVERPVSLDVMIAGLKRIQKSIRYWNKEGGRQGYLTYVGRFVP